MGKNKLDNKMIGKKVVDHKSKDIKKVTPKSHIPNGVTKNGVKHPKEEEKTVTPKPTNAPKDQWDYFALDSKYKK